MHARELGAQLAEVNLADVEFGARFLVLVGDEDPLKILRG